MSMMKKIMKMLKTMKKEIMKKMQKKMMKIKKKIERLSCRDNKKWLNNDRIKFIFISNITSNINFN